MRKWALLLKVQKHKKALVAMAMQQLLQETQRVEKKEQSYLLEIYEMQGELKSNVEKSKLSNLSAYEIYIAKLRQLCAKEKEKKAALMRSLEERKKSYLALYYDEKKLTRLYTLCHTKSFQKQQPEKN